MLTVGGDFTHDYLFNVNLDKEIREQDSFDLYAQMDWKVLESLEFVGAVRYDFFSDTDDSHFTPRVNLRYSPIRNFNLRAGYGVGFRAPSLKEKYYNFDMSGIWIVEGNPELRPEISHNFNLSAEYMKSGYNLLLSAYYNKVTDKLSTSAPYFKNQGDKIPYLPYANLNDYRVYGFDFGVQKKWFNGLSTRISYAYTHEELPKDNNGDSVNNQYIPAREHSFNVNVAYDLNFNSKYSLGVMLIGRVLSGVENQEYKNYYDISEGTVTVSYPPYSIWKLSLNCSILSGLRLSVTFDNLFAYTPKYYYLNAPVTDGFNLMVGVSIDLDKLIRI